MVTSQQIREEWYRLQPHLRTRCLICGGQDYVLLTDTQFLEPDLDELLQVLKDHHKHFNEKRKAQELDLSNLFGGAKPKNDCDNWSKSADAYVDEHYSTKDEESLQRIFGKCLGLKFNGVKTNHTKCWTYNNGLFLVEPQVPDITPFDTEKDYVYFVTTL